MGRFLGAVSPEHVASQKASTRPTDRSLLWRVPLFSGLSDEELTHLTSRVRRRRYRKGETVFHEGDLGTALFFVERGAVKIVLRSPEGKEATLGFRRQGDFFGEQALLDGETRSADVIATETCDLLLLPRDDFHQVLNTYPKVAVNLLGILSQRLRVTTRLVHAATFLDIRARVVKAILDLAYSRGVTDSSGGISIARLTQEDLGHLVGATRESVNKWLKYYERHDLLTLQRGRLVVKDAHKLRQEIFE